jgi:PncC family amidohydrolase
MTDQRLEARVGMVLTSSGLTICTAESCTGGLVLHRLTNIAGSSAYVLGGVVAYSNAIKQAVLHVSEESLIQYGAVSEQVAREMAHNVRELFGADVAVGVTGIAGPGGGTPDKPVGLTYIGLSRAGHGEIVKRFVWDGDRESNKAASAQAALQMVLDSLAG